MLESCQPLCEFFYLPVLFLEFVQQHSTQLLIQDRLDSPLVVVYNQFGVDLGHFLGNQPVLQLTVTRVVFLFIVKGDRTQPLYVFSENGTFGVPS